MNDPWYTRVFVEQGGRFLSSPMLLSEVSQKDWSKVPEAYMSRVYNSKGTYIDSNQIDIDDPDFSKVKVVHEYLLKSKNIMHYIQRTGDNFHIHVLMEPINAKKIASSMYAEFQKRVSANTGVKFDKHMMTNPLAKRRINGSLNKKNGKVITFVDNENNPVEKKIVYGENRIKRESLLLPHELKKTPRGESVKLKFTPDCVKNCSKIMQYSDTSHSERFIVLTYLYEFKDYSVDEAKRFLKKILPKEKYDHAVNEERQHIHAQRYSFPSCEKIKTQGFCNPCKFEQIRKLRNTNGQLS